MLHSQNEIKDRAQSAYDRFYVFVRIDLSVKGPDYKSNSLFNVHNLTTKIILCQQPHLVVVFACS